jgi:hypothetical protein
LAGFLGMSFRSVTYSGPRIVLFGDYLQLPPVYNAWRGQPSKRLHESRLMGLWADWNRVELNVYYRSPQTTRGSRTGSERHATRTSRSLFQTLSRDSPGPSNTPDWDLCISNDKRRAINLERQAGAIGDPMTIEGSLVQLSPGTRLISALTQQQAIRQRGYSNLQRRGHRVHFSFSNKQAVCSV